MNSLRMAALILVSVGFTFPNPSSAQDPSAKIIEYGRYKSKVKTLRPTDEGVQLLLGWEVAVG